MGAWGVKLYDDDLALDVRDEYKKLLEENEKNQYTNEELTEKMTEEFIDALDFEEDAAVFWLALADSQHRYGRMIPAVQEKALEIIDKRQGMALWEEQGEKLYKQREKVLDTLREKLLSPQPKEKNIRKKEPYICPWQIGDVFALPLESEEAEILGLKGRWILLQKVDEYKWGEPWENINPIMRLKLSANEQLPQTTEDFDALEYIQVFFDRYKEPMRERVIMRYGKILTADEIERIAQTAGSEDRIPEYRLAISALSKRELPKHLMYVGNFANAKPPELESTPLDKGNLPGTVWKFFEKIAIDRYAFYHRGIQEKLSELLKKKKDERNTNL